MAKKEKDLKLGQLCCAIQKSRLQLRKIREQRREMVRQFIGSHWSEEGASLPVPINVISLYVQIVGRNLIAKNPRVMLSSFDRAQKGVVSAMQDAVNREIVDMRLADTLKRVVQDALFSIGICKVGLASPNDAIINQWTIGAGRAFASAIDIDDWVYDVHCKDLRQYGFMGHRFRVPLEVVRENKLYSAQRKKLEATEDKLFNLEGDERISTLGRGFYSNNEEYEDFIDLWEIYYPAHRKIITLVEDSLTGAEANDYTDVRAKALCEQDWLGTEDGPYHILGYQWPPGNAMAKGPVQDIFDLHLAINNICRKLIQQARDCKTITMYAQGADNDADRIDNTNDGHSVRVDNPEAVKQVIMTMPNQQLFALMESFIQRVSWLAGNLEIIGGLGPQAKTATQDTMLNQNSSRSISDMQDTTTDFTAGVCRSLCWYFHHDPTRVMRSKYSLPGLPEFSVIRQVTPQQRMAIPFNEMDLSIYPYSDQRQTPQMRLEFLKGIVGMLAPMMPMLQQQGIAFDANSWLQKMAMYSDNPDLGEIFTIQEPPQPNDSGSASPDTIGKPADTTRRYIRESNPGRTQQGDTKNMLSSLMSGTSPGGANGKPVSAMGG